MRQNIRVEEALQEVLAQEAQLAVEEVAPEHAYGRVLASDLVARVSHPERDDSALDGYAVRLEDTQGASPEAPVRLTVIGESAAGRPFQGSVGPKQAVQIYTGAPMPEGAEAIVRVEETRREGDQVFLLAPGSVKDVRRAGSDFRQGEVGLTRGTLLTPARVALAVAMGYARLPVVRRPRVGILTTGDEVVDPGNPLPPGGVYNANAFALAGLVAEAGGEPVPLGKAPDRQEALRSILDRAGPLDLLLTSGGVSMGAYDLVRRLFEEEGEVLFWRVQMQPGGPILLARWQQLPVLGLPGNPVSSLVTFFLFGRPLLFRWLGRSDPPYSPLHALAESSFRAHPSKKTYRRARLTYRGSFIVVSTGDQNSHILRSMAEGNALVVLDPGEEVGLGAEVEAIPLTFAL
jgi:molybdopterin molybdotransferase